MNLILIIIISSIFISLSVVLISRKNYFYLFEISILFFNYISVPIIFLVDQWRSLFFLTVIIIRRRVFIFSISYIIKENHFRRFHLLLSTFVFSILLLIFRPGLFSLFLGWDGLGLRSFLLVIYYNNSKSLNAGLLTFFSNRLGDGFLLTALACGLLRNNFNIFLIQPISVMSLLLIRLLILGAITKRAQIPFSAWLPAAMAAPTPVSSLVHSSTLVTAGVYILFRLSDVLPKNLLLRLFCLGLSTIILARLRALTETDIKKIVALSTLSQLGLIIIALGLSYFSLRFFHLITHAFFKALIFIRVGEIIAKTGGHQRLKIIGITRISPIILGVLIGANLSLTGLPFFSGFFSKEIIFEFSSTFTQLSILVYMLFLIRILLTQLYTLRFMYKVILFSQNYTPTQDFFPSDKKSINGLILLIGPACLMGSFLRRSLVLTTEFLIIPSRIKIFTLSLVGLRFILLYQISKLWLNLPFLWFLSNIWILPVWSRGLFTKFFLRADSSKKIFFSNLVENIFFITIKKTTKPLLNFNSSSSGSIFQLMVLLFVLILMV